MNNNIEKFNRICLFALLIYPVFPFFSIFLYPCLMIGQKKISKITFLVWFILLSLYLGIVNATKVPESDLLANIDMFLSVEKYTFLEYVFQKGKEPVFYGLNYILYYLFNGSKEAYIIFITFISYFLIFLSIYKYFKETNRSQVFIVFSVVIFAFFPQVFSFSGHLVRQFLAGSIFMYVIIDKSFYHKNNFLLIIASFFIHTSCAVLLLCMLPFVNKKIPILILASLVAGALAILKFLPKIGLFFSGVFSSDVISYGFTRIANEIRDSASTNLGLLPVLTICVLTILALFQLYKQNIDDERLVRVLNTYLFLTIFIIGTYNNSLLSSRMFVYVYLFFPFIFPMVFHSKHKIFMIPLSISMVGFFIFYMLYSTIWTYAPSIYLFSNPIVFLL